MLYRKLKRVWSNNTFHYIDGFNTVFPELNHLSSEEMSDRWAELGVEFYYVKKSKVNLLTRLTLPLALIVVIIMFLGLPLVYIVKGRWSYDVGNGKVYNWFKSLGLG